MQLRKVAALVLIALASNDVHATEQSPRDIAPLSTVIAFAHEHHFDLGGIKGAEIGGAGKAGDTATALINLEENGESKQWVAEFVLAEATPKEIADHPPQDMHLTGENHHTVHFDTGAPIAVNIRVAGPFIAGKAPPTEERHARALTSPNLLGLGLDETCRVMLKLYPAHSPNTKNIAITDVEERAVVGCFPALMSFVQSTAETPGLKEILAETMDKPSVWSVLKSRGRVVLTLNLNGADAVGTADRLPWAPAGMTLYRLSPVLALNNQPALNCSLIVTTPKPPLLTTAGIIGIVATSPTKPKRLDIRIVSAKPAER